MAYNWLIPQDFRFSGDPFISGGKKYYGPGGLLPDYNPAQGPIAVANGDQTSYITPEGKDYFAASPELAALDPRWNDRTQMEVVGSGDGYYDVKLKSGDKEGSIVRLQKDPATGDWVNAGVQGAVGWDTNTPAIPPGMAAVMAAPFLVGGAQSLGLLGQGTMGAFPAGVGELASFGPEFVGLGGGAGILTPGVTESTLQTLGQLASGPESKGGLFADLDAAAINAGGLTDAAPWLGNVGYGPAPPNSGPPAPQGTPPTQPGTTPPPVTPPAGGATDIFKKITDGGLGALAGSDWLKLLGPLVGGGLLAYEASQQNGQQNPQDEFTRDWARGRLNQGWSPLPTNVTGGYRDAATSGLLGGNPAIPGLLQKRYY